MCVFVWRRDMDRILNTCTLPEFTNPQKAKNGIFEKTFSKVFCESH